MKTLLVLTGPQGAGNHLWSKIFALHPAVHAWKDLLNDYWVGHDREPMIDCWRDPDRLAEINWWEKDYFVTNISVPYMDNGVPTIPNIAKFLLKANQLGLNTKLAIIGRDKNILGMQEQRLRGSTTYQQALTNYMELVPQAFLSYELLQLYRMEYLRQISNQLDFPIAYNSLKIDDIIKDDTNEKYWHFVDSGPIDELAKLSSKKWK